MQHNYQRRKKGPIKLLIKQGRPTTSISWENKARYNCQLINKKPVKPSPKQGSSNRTANRARKNCYNYQLSKEEPVKLSIDQGRLSITVISARKHGSTSNRARDSLSPYMRKKCEINTQDCNQEMYEKEEGIHEQTGRNDKRKRIHE
jgi:hypothetical protein